VAQEPPLVGPHEQGRQQDQRAGQGEQHVEGDHDPEVAQQRHRREGQHAEPANEREPGGDEGTADARHPRRHRGPGRRAPAAFLDVAGHDEHRELGPHRDHEWPRHGGQRRQLDAERGDGERREADGRRHRHDHQQRPDEAALGQHQPGQDERQRRQRQRPAPGLQPVHQLDPDDGQAGGRRRDSGRRRQVAPQLGGQVVEQPLTLAE
jgi:hypothetical protein